MKTQLSSNNPFGMNAKGYLWERLSKRNPSALHLDYGAHDGRMLHLMAETGVIQQGIGVDLNSAVVERSADKLHENVKLFAISKNPTLPFPDGHFESTSIVGVLEHIHNQTHIINELVRVTKPGGEILVAVPGKHLFSFLDMGNWKFTFPRAHKWFYTLSHTQAEYLLRYAANKDGLIGDIEAEKSWHEHFSYEELGALLERHGLKVVDSDGFGFFNRVLMNLRFFVPGMLKRLLDPLIKMDAKAFSATEIWVVAKKP